MKKITYLILFLIAQVAVAQVETGENVAVTKTENGQVRGYIHKGIYTYKGIPYAEAKRFESPQKPKAWDGVRSSMTYGPVAPLMTPTTSVRDESEFVFNHNWGYTSEDCMSINVWTPAINDGKKRPVLFWIHGGGFTAGSSVELPSYDGENLAKKGDVVVVSINHRLNILGFLDLSTYGDKYKESANLSIVDMKAALEWVKTNIGNFGGDPNNVTIFGQSGGGAKVNTLMAMPAAKGLFHKAINQSGAFRSNMLDKEATQAISAQVLKELNISAANIDEIQNIPFADLSAAGTNALKVVAEQMKAAGKEIPGSAFGLSWGPSVDGTVLPFEVQSADAMNLSKNIPLMIGTTKNEFSVFFGAVPPTSTYDETFAAIKRTHGDKADAYVAAVKRAYPNIQKPSEMLDIDVMFRPGAVAQANQKAQVKGANTYMYMFDWQSPVMDGKYKAVHCMEIPFVFDNIARCEEMTGGLPDAYKLAEKISQSWINFARKGDPNHSGLPNWPVYTTENTATMHFNNTSEVRAQHDKELFDVVAK
jgi:para-nitrobenzyl esterase